MSWQYLTVKYLGRLTLPIYFGRFEVNGRENLPVNNPFILAPNHQNAFLDAIIMGCYNEKHVHFLTRSDVFVKPFIGTLESLNMMPVYRIRDGYEKLSKNEETFTRCEQLLQEGQPVLIFPEGNMADGHYLRPLTKGTSRLAFQSQSKLDKDLYIIPVGINYFHHYKARYRCIINFGKGIKVSDYQELYEKKKAKALIQLRDDLSAGMKELLLIPDKEDYTKKRTALTKDNEKVPFKTLKTQIESGEIQQSPKYWTFLSPIAQVLSVLNPLAIGIPHYILDNIIKDKQFTASLKFTLGLFLSLIWWLLIYILATVIAGWKWGLIALITCMIGLILRSEMIKWATPL